MTDYVQLATTTEAKDDAERIARSLVDERLAACVQIVGPVTSVYRWKGRIETGEEWQCIAKTRAALVDRVKSRVNELHPYEVPEILVTPIVAGSEAYLEWVGEQTQGE